MFFSQSKNINGSTHSSSCDVLCGHRPLHDDITRHLTLVEQRVESARPQHAHNFPLTCPLSHITLLFREATFLLFYGARNTSSSSSKKKRKRQQGDQLGGQKKQHHEQPKTTTNKKAPPPLPSHLRPFSHLASHALKSLVPGSLPSLSIARSLINTPHVKKIPKLLQQQNLHLTT